MENRGKINQLVDYKFRTNSFVTKYVNIININKNEKANLNTLKTNYIGLYRNLSTYRTNIGSFDF